MGGWKPEEQRFRTSAEETVRQAMMEDAARRMKEQMDGNGSGGELSDVYSRIETEGAGTFAELADILLDLNKRLRRIEEEGDNGSEGVEASS